MKQRKRLSPRAASKTFKRGARVRAVNVRRAPSRGGIRL